MWVCWLIHVCRSSIGQYFDQHLVDMFTNITIHSTRYLFSDWPKAYGEFFKSVPRMYILLQITQ